MLRKKKIIRREKVNGNVVGLHETISEQEGIADDNNISKEQVAVEIINTGEGNISTEPDESCRPLLMSDSNFNTNPFDVLMDQDGSDETRYDMHIAEEMHAHANMNKELCTASVMNENNIVSISDRSITPIQSLLDVQPTNHKPPISPINIPAHVHNPLNHSLSLPSSNFMQVHSTG